MTTFQAAPEVDHHGSPTPSAEIPWLVLCVLFSAAVALVTGLLRMIFSLVVIRVLLVADFIIAPTKSIATAAAANPHVRLAWLQAQAALEFVFSLPQRTRDLAVACWEGIDCSAVHESLAALGYNIRLMTRVFACIFAIEVLAWFFFGSEDLGWPLRVVELVAMVLVIPAA